MQEQHTTSDFKDYWRLTPQAVQKLFEKNNFKMAYVNANDDNNSSIYIFAVGCSNNSKNVDWIQNSKSNKIKYIDEFLIGKNYKEQFFKTNLFKINGIVLIFFKDNEFNDEIVQIINFYKIDDLSFSMTSEKKKDSHFALLFNFLSYLSSNFNRIFDNKEKLKIN